MKLLCLAVCLVLSVQPDGGWGKTCHSAEQCRIEECCMTRSSMVGGCRAKGCEGCPCQPNNMKSHLGDMYLMSCPCAEHLECVPGEEIINEEDMSVEYINSTCQMQGPPSTSGTLLLKLPSYLRRTSRNRHYVRAIYL